MLDFFEAPRDVTRSEKVEVVVINRSDHRRILNIEDVAACIQDVVPRVGNVSIVGFETMSLRGQIEVVRAADILVGMHGSGLALQLFMRENSAVVEIFPYRFTCRDWYERAANFSKLRYIAYHPRAETEARVTMDAELRRCFDNAMECASPLCLDKLRDQDLMVDIAAFRERIWPFFNQ
jgi:capsular polysaccharide biosynthesis protein